MIIPNNDYKLTPYLLENRSKFALILPGGGYFMVAEDTEGEAYARALNEKGYSAFVLRYRVRRKGRYPAPQEDLARAVQYILDNADELNIDPEGWSLWGSSAGGHLAAGFGTKKLGYELYNLPKPSSIILAYPVITMGVLRHGGSAMNLLGPFRSRYIERKLSIENHVDMDYPSTFLWCSKTDEIVNWRNSFLLAHELQVNRVPYVFKRYQTGHHGSGLSEGTEPEGWFDEAVAFWEENR